MFDPKQIHAYPDWQKEVERLQTSGENLARTCHRVIGWLEELADINEGGAKDCRFVSLSEACAADAKNYRATAKHIRTAVETFVTG